MLSAAMTHRILIVDDDADIRASLGEALSEHGAEVQVGVATFSSNGRWMAVRRQSTTDQRWSIEVMHPDGSAHRSVPLSFAVVRGARNPWISDDGNQLVVASADCAESQGRVCPGTVTTVYRVDVATGKTTTIASLTNAAGQLEDAMISNDGRSLVYLRDIEKRVEFYELDFSELVKGGGQP